VENLHHLLSSDEIARAERFHFARDRTSFITARGLLRTLLGRYLSLPPGQVRFQYYPHGKPALDPDIANADLRFNLAHSHGLAVYAFGRGRELGVDVEQIRPEMAKERIAERFFSPVEVAALQALPLAVREEAFFLCWTRKEAYLKATGRGLSLRLDVFDVSVAPDAPAALLAARHDPHEVDHWTLHTLRPAPGYVGALAVEGHGWTLWCGTVPDYLEWFRTGAKQATVGEPGTSVPGGSQPSGD
jgi:4'-phosphopantetheinyl transferase